MSHARTSAAEPQQQSRQKARIARSGVKGFFGRGGVSLPVVVRHSDVGIMYLSRLPTR